MKMAIDGIKSERAQLQPKVINGLPRGSRAPRPRIVPRGLYISRPGMAAPDAKKKSAIFAPQRRNTALAVPTKHLSTRATHIKKAPRSLIEEHRRPMEQSVRRENHSSAAQGRVILPGRTASGSTLPSSSYLAEREARLKAIASGKPVPLKPLPSSADPTTDNTPSSRDSPASSARDAQSLGKRTIPKRRATSPCSQIASQSSTKFASVDSPPLGRADNTGSGPTSRPAVVRKRTEVDIFLRPKKKRVI